MLPGDLETFLRNSRRYGIRGVFFEGDDAQRQIKNFADSLVEREVIGSADRAQMIAVLSRELVDLRHLTADAAADAICSGPGGLLA